MALLPNRNIFDGTLPPTTGNMKNALGQLRDFLADCLGTDSSISTANRNKLINSNFNINRRQVSGTVVLAAGAYGHDRWKAGSGGCTYTFTKIGLDTQITISAGSLMQIVEEGNIEGGVYSVSHEGTSAARIGVDGVTPSGAYTAATKLAPLMSVLAVANQRITVEFSTGVVHKAMLQVGGATVYERYLEGQELLLCQRYLPTVGGPYVGTGNMLAHGLLFNSTVGIFLIEFMVEPRVAPTSITATAANFDIMSMTSGYPVSALSSPALVAPTKNSAQINFNLTTASTAFAPCRLRSAAANAVILFNGCEL